VGDFDFPRPVLWHYHRDVESKAEITALPVASEGEKKNYRPQSYLHGIADAKAEAEAVAAAAAAASPATSEATSEGEEVGGGNDGAFWRYRRAAADAKAEAEATTPPVAS
ncbi:hypothetical protein BGZ47_007725, partial [Haplosporangium gracile]